jgi:hypothetical protein
MPAMVLAIGFCVALFPTLFRRRTSDSPQVFENLLARVQQLRQGKLPARYAHHNAVKVRAKLVTEARKKLDEKSFFTNRQPP